MKQHYRDFTINDGTSLQGNFVVRGDWLLFLNHPPYRSLGEFEGLIDDRGYKTALEAKKAIDFSI